MSDHQRLHFGTPETDSKLYKILMKLMFQAVGLLQ